MVRNIWLLFIVVPISCFCMEEMTPPVAIDHNLSMAHKAVEFSREKYPDELYIFFKERLAYYQKIKERGNNHNFNLERKKER